MIIGQLENLASHLSHLQDGCKLMEIIKNWQSLNQNHWYDLTSYIRVIRLADWNRNEAVFESHKDNVDLHVAIAGADIISFCQPGAGEITSPYDREKDCTFFRVYEYSEVTLETGDWALVFPGEIHRNRFANEITEKLVFKLHFSLWEK